MTEVRVWPRHGRKLGLCMAGQRRWAKSVGIDFRAFVKEGLTVEALEPYSGEENIRRMIELAKRDAENG